MEVLINSLPWNSDFFANPGVVKQSKLKRMKDTLQNIRPQNLSNNSITGINSRHLNGIYYNYQFNSSNSSSNENNKLALASLPGH